MKVLLFGGRGMLGRDVIRAAPPDVIIAAPQRSEVDIRDPRAVASQIERNRPDVIVNSAAYTAVDEAEAQRDDAFATNAVAVGALGEAAASSGALVVHFGTDYVFDGTARRPYREEDVTNPLNAYGASKLAGEQRLRASGAAHLILRTQWLYGGSGRSFPRAMLERARHRQPTRVVNDQFGSLTCTADLSHAMWALIRRGQRGTFHVVNEGVASWYDVARAIFSELGAEDCLAACTTAEFPRPARRPAFAALSTGKAAAALGRTLRPWREPLHEFLTSSMSQPT